MSDGVGSIGSAEVARLLAHARQQHRAGGAAVLDELRRAASASGAEVLAAIEAAVEATTGVAAWRPEQGGTADFSILDIDSARRLRCVLLRHESGPVLLVAEDPWDEGLLRRVARLVQFEPVPVAAERDTLRSLLGERGGRGESQGQLVALASGGGSLGTVGEPEQQAAAGPIVAFVDQALLAAMSEGASDVHFECDRGGVSARLRLDGVLVPFARLDGAQNAQQTISRIKVMAMLDITERRLPQDGRLRFERGGTPVDLRVSIMPSVHGEDAVLRLLDRARLRQASARVSLDALGFDAHAAAAIRELAARPSGMLLVTGPTGSGKTTTVYAALSEINTGGEKFVTIEDPVEYELPGVLQIPVNERKGLTFAKGLRSILRHDPDRILVGEIRDAETADIAVQSALTGHLVFTTVHANSLADVIGRFRHFGIDMFGLTSSLNGVVVQRLIRRTCPHCAAWREPKSAEAEWLARCGVADATRVPTAPGCDACRRTGFLGRLVIAETHAIDDELRDLIVSGAPLLELKRATAARGVRLLATLAAEHVARGRTTIEEVRRVVGWG